MALIQVAFDLWGKSGPCVKTQIQFARSGRYLPLSFLIFLRLAIGSLSSILASFCGVVLVGFELGHSASSDSSV